MNSSGLEWSVFTRGVSEGGTHVWGQRVGVCVLRDGGGGGGGVPNCAQSLADHFH